jgi:hypothetical protein
VDLDPGWQIGGLVIIFRDQTQMQIILLAGQAPRQQGDDLRRATTAEMRDEQKDPGTLRHGLVKGKLSISQFLEGVVSWPSLTLVVQK